jgi:heme/copper-type cytochrome/quinol oxidase subunit 3
VTATPEARAGRKLLDVSHLPTYAFGHRDPLWWGVTLLMAIESTMFVLVVVTYFYLRGNFAVWPPPGVVQPSLLLTGGTVLAMIAASVPLIWSFRAALNARLRPVQLGFLLATIFTAVAVVLRCFEFARLAQLYRWNSHAYGSVIWTLYGMHSLHLGTGLIENALFTALLYVGPVEKKHMLDARLSCAYWWFVAVIWIPLWALIFFDNRMLG